MSSLKPLGIFWDINDFSIPLTITTNEWIKHLRKFISNQLNNDCIEYQFSCFCGPNLINDSITQSLKENGCDILHIDSNSEINVFIKLDQIIGQFVEKYGFDTIVVLISNNSYLNSTVRLIKHREVSVLWISNQKPNQSFIEWIPFDDVLELNRTVILSITNIPNDKSRKTIRNSFIPFCQHFRCKFRFNRRESVKLEFNDVKDAERALIRLNGLQFFGQDLNIEVISSHDNLSVISSSSVHSSTSSLVSFPLAKRPTLLPQNDDKCKSVIIGLFTKYNQNVFKLVRNLVKNWKDPTLSDTIIYRVNRERDFIGRDGRASLIVTATDRQSNNKLISSAKKYFVDKDNKLYWNRLQRSKKDCKQIKSSIVSSQKSETNSSYQKISPFNQSFHSTESLQSNDDCLSPKTDTIISYASIASKPLIIENSDNSNPNQISIKRVDLNMKFSRRRNINSSCQCQ